MLRDTQYLKAQYHLSELAHQYGKNVRILSDPYLFSTLARLCAPECKQPLVNSLLNTLYRELVKCVLNCEFPTTKKIMTTRMLDQHLEGKFEAEVISPDTKVVSVSLARAGTVPSHICFDAFNYLLNPDGVRQDHISINRKTDAAEKVVGTNLGGIKIGGDIEDAIVVFPDPMGATGSTILTALDLYKKEVKGTAKRFVAIHLIVTPEYLAKVCKAHPDVVVYAIRLDRGLSTADVLATEPGTHWDKEKGLSPKDYIVPGGGGLGEVINNSYV